VGGTSPISEDAAVRRLVRRFGLGPRWGELERALAAGFDATLAALTTPSPTPDPGVAATPAPTFGPTQRLGRNADRSLAMADRGQRADDAARLGVWWLDRMAAVRDPYPERMTWFWHGHFATSVRKVKFPRLMYLQNDTQRQLGRGDFHRLAQAMIVNPAMLVWLDGGGNRVGKPNENLAREFMELFTLGVGNYTEDDVRQAARVLTGWRVDYRTDTASLAAGAHDPGPETVLGASGGYDAAGLVDLLLRQPASPRFVASRVWTRFVSDIPPDPATLDRLVAAYGAGHITALIVEAVRSPGFRDPTSVLVTEPVLWLVGALRALGLPASALPARPLRAALTGLGQVPFTPPNVGGWPAGPPWLTTAAALARLRVARVLTTVADLIPVSTVAPSGRVDMVAALLGLPGFTDRTAAALRTLVRQPADLVAVALASPEYTVSA
jgi:uncharacterized protein (DUF1800 family)